MMKTRESAAEAFDYFSNGTGMVFCYFVTEKVLLSYQEFSDRLPVLTVFDKRINAVLMRMTDRQADKIDGYGRPMGILEGRLACYRPDDGERSAGVVTLAEIPLPPD